MSRLPARNGNREATNVIPVLLHSTEDKSGADPTLRRTLALFDVQNNIRKG